MGHHHGHFANHRTPSKALEAGKAGEASEAAREVPPGPPGIACYE